LVSALSQIINDKFKELVVCGIKCPVAQQSTLLEVSRLGLRELDLQVGEVIFGHRHFIGGARILFQAWVPRTPNPNPDTITLSSKVLSSLIHNCPVFAYVFWHQRDDAYPAQLYEEGLTSFHTRLSSLGVRGFLGSFSFKVSGVPWITGEGYEDWYLVDGLGVLEEINSLITDPTIRGVHDGVARMSINGKATILAHIKGDPTLIDAPNTYWLAKPRGTSYDDFYRGIESLTRDAVASVWRRQLALGPNPEFLMITRTNPRLPEAYLPRPVSRRMLITSRSK